MGVSAQSRECASTRPRVLTRVQSNLNSLSSKSTLSIDNLNATSTTIFTNLNSSSSKSTLSIDNLNATSTTIFTNLNSISTYSKLNIYNLSATSTSIFDKTNFTCLARLHVSQLLMSQDQQH